jgi:hypothetical protein
LIDEPGDQQHNEDQSPDDQPDEASASRNLLLETIGIDLLNAGVLTPAKRFIQEVRDAAGYRVNPRNIATAVSQITRAGQEVTPQAVADIANAIRGEHSQRQQRNSGDWRVLGTALTLQGKDGTPQGQRAFISESRLSAGPRATDALLLHVAIAIANANKPLRAETVGTVAARLASSAADLSRSDIPGLVRQELRHLDNPKKARYARRSSVGARREAPQSGRTPYYNPGARKLRPGNRRGAGIKRTIKGEQDEPS